MGVLYIIGTVAGVLSLVVMQGRLDGPDYLARMASDATPVMVGALLVLLMGLALALVPVVVFPILKRHSEALAIGYIVFRGALETTLYIGTATCWLLLIVLARQSADAGGAAVSQVSGLGNLLVAAGDPITAVNDIVFSIGALMFYSVLYRARLIPRWISGWGLAGVMLFLAAGVIAVFSTERVILLLPLGLQEMVMAVWLIVKGFDPGASTTGIDPQPLAGGRRAGAAT